MAGAMQAQPSTGSSAKPSGGGVMGDPPAAGASGTQPSVQQFLQMLSSQPGHSSIGGLQALMNRKTY